MYRKISFVLMSVTLAWPNIALSAEPPKGVQAGYDAGNGLVLLGELNCVACHASTSDLLLPKQPPILAEVGGRVTPQYLRAFLAQPQKVKPGSTMPDMLHALPAKKRNESVDALVHYLVSLGGPIDQRSSGSSLSQIERGKQLYHTAGCVACHEPTAPPPKQDTDLPKGLTPKELAELKLPGTAAPRPSVPLGELAMKTTVAQLAAFLNDPLHVRPSGRMPSLHLQPGEANLIAAYLLRDQYSDKEKAPGVGLDFTYYEGQWSRMPDFDKLKPKQDGASKGLDLSVLKDGKLKKSNFALRFQGIIEIPKDGKYRFWTKSDDGSILKIDNKVVVNNDGLHPPQERNGAIDLTKGRHTIDLGMFQGGGGFELSVYWQPPGAKSRTPIPPGILLHSAAAMIPKGIVDFKIDANKAEAGKKLFASLGCVNCHVTDRKAPIAKPTIKGPALAQLKPNVAGGCLGNKVAAGRPRFAFSDTQRKAVGQALTGLKKTKALTAHAKVHHVMTSFRCYSCHSRDGKGGPDVHRANYFAYEVRVDLGDEGRYPPPLLDVGAKLTDAGFEDALFSGKKYRSYMATRMPNFGKANLGHLPKHLRQADAGKIKPHQPTFTTRMVDEGRRMIGNKALACINCHAWGEMRLSGAEGLDLLEITRRIKPDWFHAFLIEPQKLKPRTRMPTAWPDGKSFFPKIQNGDMHKQIDAIWAYFSAGRKGGMPPGLSPDDKSLLVPASEPIVFRTFLNQVSAHSILVGYRQRTHVVFDANRVRMVQAWTGDFISTKAAWDGRAGQYAKLPSTDIVKFPDGPPFAVLKSQTDDWPADVAKKRLGSNRTPPGWRFRGYRYDDKRIPTFLYQVGNVRVEETPITEFQKDHAYLLRRFRMTSSEEVKDLYLRLVVGKKIVPDQGEFVVDDRLRYKVKGSKPIVRSAGKNQELLVPIKFTPPSGNKPREANLDVELKW